MTLRLSHRNRSQQQPLEASAAVGIATILMSFRGMARATHNWDEGRNLLQNWLTAIPSFQEAPIFLVRWSPRKSIIYEGFRIFRGVQESESKTTVPGPERCETWKGYGPVIIGNCGRYWGGINPWTMEHMSFIFGQFSSNFVTRRTKSDQTASLASGKTFSRQKKVVRSG